MIIHSTHEHMVLKIRVSNRYFTIKFHSFNLSIFLLLVKIRESVLKNGKSGCDLLASHRVSSFYSCYI